MDDTEDMFTHVVYDPYDKCPKYIGHEDDCCNWLALSDPQKAGGLYVREATAMEQTLFSEDGLFDGGLLLPFAQIVADRMGIPVADVGDKLRQYGGPGKWARDALYEDMIGPVVDRMEDFVRNASGAQEC